MINIGIVGGAGYTAGELIRILLNHPQARLAWVHSQSQGNKPLANVHTDLWGETEMVFSQNFDFEAIDAIFLCSGHGESQKFLSENPLPARVKVIDLSTDFRYNASVQDNWVYGLPELNKNLLSQATKVANPGCFATAIQLALLPLAKNQKLRADVQIHAITGSTGAGQRPTEHSHFSWRNNNLSVYKPFQHQHLHEITQSIKQLQGDFASRLNFIPLRGDFTRGIFVTAFTECDWSLAQAQACYQSYYQDTPFTILVQQNPDLKQVVNTNKCFIYLEKHDNQLFIISLIDNLLKGASGQAVQNMNLMFGLDETMGLKLKSGVF
ncbi:MAG: N-acetyl-gamma-glutamyl-phosphate reductase [Microscillaceae bacterium]|jgi:N-acetyl-gamma-glutamyl-phosphate reductase|nr:N-acetyl-gamma-glutamyl-phosphate reductase [Microscillaceae bacterium]